MTRQETFKRRVRERMAKTGERYNAARRVLVEQSEAARAGRDGKRAWVAEPELGDESVRAATGRGWDEWCDVIDAWPGHDQGHGAVAAYLVEEHRVDGWWAQSVTVGWERITGRRLPFQTADGTFTANKSRTVVTDHEALRAMLLDADGREVLFPGLDTELRSRPSSKNVRVAVGPGTAEIAIEPRAGGKVKVTIAHHRLPTPGEVELWKEFWTDWLDALHEG